jgi:hypothetical protein
MLEIVHPDARVMGWDAGSVQNSVAEGSCHLVTVGQNLVIPQSYETDDISRRLRRCRMP